MASSEAAAASAMDVDGEAPPPFVFEAPLYPASHKLSALLYEDVANAEELRAALLSGDLPEFALLNADRVASMFHLLLAGSTALMHQRAGTLHVRTLHAELIYALAPGTSISEAFRVFGAGKGDTKVLAAFIDAPPGVVARVAAAVKGRPVQGITAHLDARPLSSERLSRFRKVFKLGSGGGSQQQGKGKGKGKGKKQGWEGRDGEEEEEEGEEDLERAIVSRIAAKHVL